jgi:hypothetical protein
MDRIFVQFVQQVEQTGRRQMRMRMFAWSGAAAVILIGLTWAGLQFGPSTAKATEVFARGVEAAANLDSIYIKCRMRTLPGDNFGSLDLKHEFVDVELWKQFRPTLKWRIEKPGRVAAMNGRETVMLIDNRAGVKIDTAAPSAFDTEWLHRLAAIDGVLSSELAAASVPGQSMKTTLVKEAEDQGHKMIVAKVEADREVGEYLRNKFLSASDTRREYAFETRTNRLEGARVYCRDGSKDVLVLEIVQIQYDPPIADSQFELQIPEGVVWYQEPQRLPDNDKYEQMTPAQAAQTFFEACSKRDWDEAAKFWTMAITDEFKQYLGGLEITSLGEPFQSKPYPGWFVPYEIRLNGGTVKKHNLAIRNDNPAKRFVVDGGL